MTSYYILHLLSPSSLECLKIIFSWQIRPVFFVATCNDIINRKISKSTLNFDECSVAAHFYFNFKISFYFTFLCIFLLSFEHKRQIKVFRNTKYHYVSFIIHSGTTNFKHISFEETFKFINFQQYINNNTILHFIGIIIIKTFNFI